MNIAFELTLLGAGRFTPTLIALVIFGYLCQRRQKDLGTIWFAYYFFFLSIYNIGYIIGYSVNSPAGRFGWYLACAIVFAAASRIQISFTFPKEVLSKPRKIILIATFFLGVVSLLDYFYFANDSNTFGFVIHSFGSKYSSKFIPFLTFLFYLLSLLVSIYRMEKIVRNTKGRFLGEKVKKAWISSSEIRISFALFCLTIVEISITILYFLAIQRVLKINDLAEILNLGGLLIFASYSLVYSSSASGRTGIITRLVGITLVSFLVIFFFVTRYYQSRLIDDYYVELHRDSMLTHFSKKGFEGKSQIYTLKLKNHEPSEGGFDAVLRLAYSTAIFDGMFHFFKLGDYPLVAVAFTVENDPILGIIRYDEYRQRIHQIVSSSLVFSLIVTLLVLFIFPLMFRANFIQPLNHLMKDLSELSPKYLDSGSDEVANEIVTIRNTFVKMAEILKRAKGNIPEVTSQIEILDKILNLEAQKIQVGNQTLVYRSSAVRKTLEEVAQASRYRFPILITGETGTGKELISKLIHESSDEAKGPFVAINCAALPENLWESEIFGHKKGSFTDAKNDRKGRVLEASGGSLFFDEIGEMPLTIQSKLLRLLQENTFSPLGSDQTLNAECRFIFATNRDLDSMVRQKLFREDLLYRIRVIPIALPSLRDRIEDIPHLVRFFVDRFASEYNLPSPNIDSALLQRLIAYSWPGNIREMENTVIRAMATNHGETLTLKHFQSASIGQVLRSNESTIKDYQPSSSYEEQMRLFSRNLIETVYLQCQRNVTKTAKALSMKRTTLRYQLIELGLLDRKK